MPYFLIGKKLAFAGAMVLLLAFVIPGDVCADVVVMKNGSKFGGKVLQDGPGKVVLKMQFGTMEFPRSRVKEIIKQAVPADPKPDQGRPEPEPVTPQPDKPKASPAPSCGEGNYLRENNKTLDIKDAVAVKCGNYQLSVTFFPFELTSAELAEVKQTKNPYELVKKKPSPSRKSWAECPYVRLDMEFANDEKKMDLSNVSEARMCIYGTVWRNHGGVLKNGEKGATVDVKKLELTMEGAEGSLEIEVGGKGQIELYRMRGTDRRNCTWQMDLTCPVVSK